jgi:hypothetical protein
MPDPRRLTLTLAERRECALMMATWAARRLATCEAHYFAATVEYDRTWRTRAQVRRNRWRKLAVEFGDYLEEGGNHMARLGMLQSAREIATEAGIRISDARRDFLTAQGLDPAIRRRYPLGCVRRPGPPRGLPGQE